MCTGTDMNCVYKMSIEIPYITSLEFEVENHIRRSQERGDKQMEGHFSKSLENTLNPFTVAVM